MATDVTAQQAQAQRMQDQKLADDARFQEQQAENRKHFEEQKAADEKVMAERAAADRKWQQENSPQALEAQRQARETEKIQEQRILGTVGGFIAGFTGMDLMNRLAGAETVAQVSGPPTPPAPPTSMISGLGTQIAARLGLSPTLSPTSSPSAPGTAASAAFKPLTPTLG